jgi:cyclopropane-fatty-acyl-phospholipid synthase
MGLLSLEHSRAAYAADFVLYGAAVLALSITLLAVPAARTPAVAALVLAGVAGWTLLEYVLHRFVLHGLQPFKGWHDAHHARPTALICAPTLLSAGLIAGGVFAPAWWLGTPWQASALTLGVLAGYLAYATTHHAVHHWHRGGSWLLARKRWHARHHSPRPGQAPCYGVTSGLWDHAFGSTGR